MAVALDVQTVSYLGIESVESVEIRWLEDDGSGNKMLTFGRPGCTSMAAAAGQAQFT